MVTWPVTSRYPKLRAQYLANGWRQETSFQRTLNRKWYMRYQMVTWPVTSRDPQRCCEEERSTILSIAWLLVLLQVLMDCCYGKTTGWRSWTRCFTCKLSHHQIELWCFLLILVRYALIQMDMRNSSPLTKTAIRVWWQFDLWFLIKRTYIITECMYTHIPGLSSWALVFVLVFYPRDAMLARVIVIATCLSIRPSVRLSRAGIVLKRRKLAAWFLHLLVAPRL